MKYGDKISQLLAGRHDGGARYNIEFPRFMGAVIAAWDLYRIGSFGEPISAVQLRAQILGSDNGTGGSGAYYFVLAGFISWLMEREIPEEEEEWLDVDTINRELNAFCEEAVSGAAQ